MFMQSIRVYVPRDYDDNVYRLRDVIRWAQITHTMIFRTAIFLSHSLHLGFRQLIHHVECFVQVQNAISQIFIMITRIMGKRCRLRKVQERSEPQQYIRKKTVHKDIPIGVGSK